MQQQQLYELNSEFILASLCVNNNKMCCAALSYHQEKKNASPISMQCFFPSKFTALNIFNGFFCLLKWSIFKNRKKAIFLSKSKAERTAVASIRIYSLSFQLYRRDREKWLCTVKNSISHSVMNQWKRVNWQANFDADDVTYCSRLCIIYQCIIETHFFSLCIWTKYKKYETHCNGERETQTNISVCTCKCVIVSTLPVACLFTLSFPSPLSLHLYRTISLGNVVMSSEQFTWGMSVCVMSSSDYMPVCACLFGTVWFFSTFVFVDECQCSCNIFIHTVHNTQSWISLVAFHSNLKLSAKINECHSTLLKLIWFRFLEIWAH